MPMMVKPISFQRFLGVAFAVVLVLGGRAAATEPLRLITFALPPLMDLSHDNAPGLNVEVLRRVFATMGRTGTFEEFPLARAWATFGGGERDGMAGVVPTSERAAFCLFPDEPLTQERWVFFVRTADAGRLTFSSFEDLVGHDIAVTGPVGGVYVPPDLWKFLQDHHNNMVNTTDPTMVFRMLQAGRVDYAIVSLTVGTWEIAAMGLSGQIEPLLSRSVMESGYYVCFSKARVDPAFVEAFSRALREFKQTDAFQAIYHKYFP
jgi:polar amino acid transport system substrate-binding protein